MNIYKIADSIELLANEAGIHTASAAAASLNEWDAAKALDAIDIINACAILAEMAPDKAARIMSYNDRAWVSLIFEDMGEPWGDAIRHALGNIPE